MSNEQAVDVFVKKQHELVDKVMREVLTRYLKRPPSLADAKKTKRIFTVGDNNKFMVVYNDEVLGNVELIYPDPTKEEKTYGVTFKEVS